MLNPTSNRLFLSKLADKAINTVTRSLGKNLLHKPTPMVTEPRRPLEVRKPFEADLSERLREQRRLRQSLIPEELRVTNKGTMLELRWKEEDLSDETRNSQIASSSSSSSSSSSTTTETTALTNGEARPHPRRRPPTRLLAELLRAQSPSTDVIGSNHLVYGKRGLKITEVVPMGQYAVRLQFSDSHSGGIYPYDYLEMIGRVGDGWGGEGRPPPPEEATTPAGTTTTTTHTGDDEAAAESDTEDIKAAATRLGATGEDNGDVASADDSSPSTAAASPSSQQQPQHSNKFRIMRGYIKALKASNKTRNPPRPISRMKESACSKK